MLYHLYHLFSKCFLLIIYLIFKGVATLKETMEMSPNEIILIAALEICKMSAPALSTEKSFFYLIS